MITNEALMQLKNNLGFSAGVNRQYDDQFGVKGGKIGSVINIRKPVRYTTTSGAALNLQNVADQYVPLTLDTQEHVGFQFSSKELELSIDEFSDRYIKPAVVALANKIDYDGCQQYLNVFNSVGTPGTAPTAMSTALSAGQRLDENGAPIDEKRMLVLPPSLQTAFLGAGLTLFNDQAELSKQYIRGRMGRAAGFMWSMDQNMPTHTTGAIDGTPLVNSTSAADGDTQIAFDGTSTASITGAYKAGDVITFAGVYEVNPQSKVSNGVLKQFVVTADCNASSNAGTVHFSPAFQSTGQYQNISALPANDAAIKLFGAATTYASKTSPVGMAYHRDAFALGMADLPLPGGVDMAARAKDEDAGLSIRIVRAYDINNDVFPCRLDVLYGWKTLYPELAARVQG